MLNKLHCDMHRECTQTVTMIGNKGFVYCAQHGVSRRASGYEQTRKLTALETRTLEHGGTIRYAKGGK